jgi:hypothetical protein
VRAAEDVVHIPRALSNVDATLDSGKGTEDYLHFVIQAPFHPGDKVQLRA